MLVAAAKVNQKKLLLLIASNTSSSSFRRFQACPLVDSSAVQFAPNLTDITPISNNQALPLMSMAPSRIHDYSYRHPRCLLPLVLDRMAQKDQMYNPTTAIRTTTTLSL